MNSPSCIVKTSAMWCTFLGNHKIIWIIAQFNVKETAQEKERSRWREVALTLVEHSSLLGDNKSSPLRVIVVVHYDTAFNCPHTGDLCTIYSEYSTVLNKRWPCSVKAALVINDSPSVCDVHTSTSTPAPDSAFEPITSLSTKLAESGTPKGRKVSFIGYL